MEVSRKKEAIIDVDKVDSSNDLQELLKLKLKFPDLYGQNWNAFWDTITGLVELPEINYFLKSGSS